LKNRQSLAISKRREVAKNAKINLLTFAVLIILSMALRFLLLNTQPLTPQIHAQVVVFQKKRKKNSKRKMKKK